MFEQIGTVIIVIVVLVVGAGLGLFAGFVLGRHKGQEMARGVKSEELEEAKTSLENARFENAELSARNAAAQAQIEGVNQQLAFAKSQLARSRLSRFAFSRNVSVQLRRQNGSVRRMLRPPRSSVLNRKHV